MRKSIPPETLQQIRDRIDLVDVVSRYVTLSKTGQSYKGLCPFHTEKTPSFTVNPGRQMFYCFGCSAGGDAFAFLMKHEGLEFMEAVRELSQQVGIPLPENRGNFESTSASVRERYMRVQTTAADWFQENLKASQLGKVAGAYVEDRGLTSDTIQEFGLGFAPSSWDGLIRFLQKEGMTQEELTQSGLVVKKEATGEIQRPGHQLYDRFRGRLMFPISNLSRQVVAFGGRILEKEGTPKYLNSPETHFFSKGRLLYGLEKAREAAHHDHSLMIVEGYFDVMTLHQAGMKNVVAPLGTALTRDHIQMIRRFASTVVLLFDGDAAGVGAVLRTLDLFVNTDLTVKVVVLPSGDDPDTFVRTCGIEPFLTLVERADGLIDFALARCLAGRKAGSVTDRVRCADEVLRIIQKTKNPIQKEEYIKLVSENLGVGEQVLMERYPMLIAQPRTHAGKSPEPEPKRIGSLMKGNPEERDLVMLLLQGSLQVDHLRQLKGKVFTVPNYRHIVEMGLRYVGENGALMLTDFRAEAMNDSECAPLVAQLTVVDQHFDDVETYIQGCLTVIERKRLQANLDTLITQLRKAERDGQQNEVDRLNLQIDHLRGQKAALMATSVPVGR